MPAYELSPCQQKAFEVFTQTEKNIFLSGAAGTGKSFLIRKFLGQVDIKRFPLVASTGAAAVLIGGRTFHSFFGLGLMEGGLERTVAKALNNRRLVSRLRKIDGFILDEVSMISGSTLKAAETIARFARESQRPWGGLRIIAVGDFFQLPPVEKNNQHLQKPWAFFEEVWQESEFHPLILETMLRSDDEEFLRILQEIRSGDVSEAVHDYLNQRLNPGFESRKATYLFSRRNQVDAFNHRRLEELDSPLLELPTVYRGKGYAVENLKKQAPIPEVLRLKKSALVMIRINDTAMRYVNGSLGEIVDMDEENLAIMLQKNGKIVDIPQHSFSALDAEGQETASATNFPVNLAYASTIHKAQGLTLDQIVADLRSLWEPGQAYVALSRLRTGDGLTLTGWHPESIKADPEVKRFYRELS